MLEKKKMKWSKSSPINPRRKIKGNIRDPDDWQRVRSAIEHENTLANYRLAWLGALQTFLFAAFGFILSESMKLQSNDTSLEEKRLILLYGERCSRQEYKSEILIDGGTTRNL